MEIEMKLQDALSLSVLQFKEKISVINNEMKTRTINHIKFVQEESESFSEKLREVTLKEQDAFTARPEAEGDEVQ